MAQTPFSRLLLRRFCISSTNPRRGFPLFTAIRPLSTSSSSSDSNPQSSLSARMSFVFDQIDALEKERSEKDETLQRIRAWRDSKKASNPGLESELSKDSETVVNSPELEPEPEPKLIEAENSMGFKTKSEIELVHPWPEWIDLMERLVQQNYFDHRRKDEDKMIEDVGFFRSSSMDSRAGDSSGLDFKNLKLVQTACVNFGKDRFDIFRSISRQDIQTLVGFGCPSADKKVVFSAKLLRKHVHLDEGDVCSSCSLRSSCDRAYLLTMKEDEARFIDIMRVLLAYGFDPLNGAELNPSPMKQKSVKTAVRKLLHQVVKLSSVPIDPNLPPPIIKRPPPKVKQAPPPPRKRVGRDDIEMKKGDWLCPKCDFMNFAKNNVCLQCDAKRPKRQLLPGEWECPQCNFLNYRRNLVCFHCECKRPHDDFTGNKLQEKQQGPRMAVENMTNRSEVSNAWNFDFDDDESDGADVAAFEYADSSVMEKGPFDKKAQGGRFERPEFDFNKASRDVRFHGGEYSDADTGKPGVGFDDFDDEEDDIDNYEIDTGDKDSEQMVSSNDFSKFEGNSGSEAISRSGSRTKSPPYNSQSKPMRRRALSESDDDLDLDSDGELSPKPNPRHGTKSRSFNKQSKVTRKGRAFSGSEDDELDSDSDSELSAKPKWKSSHVADSRPRGRGSNGTLKGLSFGSDDELGMYSDMDEKEDRNLVSNREKANDFRRRGSHQMKDPFSGSESEKEGTRFYGNKLRGNARTSRSDTKFKSKNRRSSVEDDDDDDFDDDSERSSQWSRGRGFRGNNNEPRTNGRRNFREPRSGGFRRNSFEDEDDDFGRLSQGSHRRGRGNNSAPRMGDRKGGARSFDEPRRGGFRKQQGGERDSENRGFQEFKNSRRVIER